MLLAILWNIVTSYHVISLFFHLIRIFSLHCQSFLLISGITRYAMYLKKAGLAAEYTTPTKNASTFCRLLLLFSSLHTWSRLDHYWSNVHQRDHRSGCLLKRFIVILNRVRDYGLRHTPPPRLSLNVSTEITGSGFATDRTSDQGHFSNLWLSLVQLMD